MNAGNHEFMMSFYFIGFTVRAYDIVMIMFIMTIFQLLVLAAGKIMKRPIAVFPLVEFILRPIFIGIIDRLNRSNRTDFALKIRGLIMFSVCLVFVFGSAILLKFLMGFVGYDWASYYIVLMVIVSPLGLFHIILSASKTQTPTKGVYKSLAQATNQNLINDDHHGIRRVAYQALIVNGVEWCIAPSMFFIFCGMNGALAYVSLSLFVRLSGQNSMTFLSLFQKLHHVLFVVVDSVSAFFILLASLFTPGGNLLQSMKAFRHRGAFSLAAYAYGQNIVLGGAGQDRYGQSITKKWIGRDGATAKLSHKDVIRGAMQYVISLFLFCVMLFACVALYFGF